MGNKLCECQGICNDPESNIIANDVKCRKIIKEINIKENKEQNNIFLKDNNELSNDKNTIQIEKNDSLNYENGSNIITNYNQNNITENIKIKSPFMQFPEEINRYDPYQYSSGKFNEFQITNRSKSMSESISINKDENEGNNGRNDLKFFSFKDNSFANGNIIKLNNNSNENGGNDIINE